MFVWRESEHGLLYLELTGFREEGIKALFTSRIGGVSQGPYSSLNLGLHTGDQTASVKQNRDLVAEAVGVDFRHFTAGEQVHGKSVHLVEAKDRGRGALRYEESIPGVDALVTAQRGIPLFSFYADCVPLFIIDPIKRVVALSHAGWQGTVQQIARETVNTMVESLSVDVKDCYAAVGPAISADNYQVDEPVIEKVKAAFPDWQEFVVDQGKGRYLLDLKMINYMLLTGVGIPEEQITVSRYCTYQESHFFYSYRRDRGVTGRMASIILIE